VLGRKPFGYYRGEGEIIARMQSLRAAGLGFDRIADRLNEDDIPSCSGKSWHGIVVNRILSRTVRRMDPCQMSAGRVPRGKDSRHSAVLAAREPQTNSASRSNDAVGTPSQSRSSRVFAGTICLPVRD
jgi:hypothetical protein